MRAAFVTFVVSLLCLTVAPPAGADQAECAITLDCTAEEINQLSMPERLDFVREISAGVIPGYAPRWRNIEGIVDFFIDHNLGEPGSWVSYVDAGILEGLERGIAIARGQSSDTFGNPGSQLWASYITRLREGLLADRSAHDRAWSEAEQASTEHGAALAEQVHAVVPSGVEQRFYEFSECYRWTLRNRPTLLDPTAPEIGPGRQRQITFVDWFTDVTNPTPSRSGAELAYDLAEFDLPGGTLSALALFHAYAVELLDEYLAETS